MFEFYRMSVAVKRDTYPVDVGQTFPGHTIVIMAPVTLTNLLPHELGYKVGNENGRIVPGGSADLHTLNNEEQLIVVVELDGYSGTGNVSRR